MDEGAYLCLVLYAALLQVNHNQSLEDPAPVAAPFASAQLQSTARRRLTAVPPGLDSIPHHRTTASNLTTAHAWGSANHAAMAELVLDPADRAAMAELMLDSSSSLNRRLTPGSRSLLAAEEVAVAADLWFGYDVQYRPHDVERAYGNWTPRYVGLRNQVLGGLYFQQVIYNH